MLTCTLAHTIYILFRCLRTRAHTHVFRCGSELALGMASTSSKKGFKPNHSFGCCGVKKEAKRKFQWQLKQDEDGAASRSSKAVYPTIYEQTTKSAGNLRCVVTLW